MNKIKVLHFIWSANFGGIEKMAIVLAAEQNRSAHVDAALLIGCKKGDFFDLIARYKIPLFNGELKSGYDLGIRKMLRIHKIMKSYDIIHFHTFNIIVMVAAIFSGRKIIYTNHGNFNYGKNVSAGDKINNLLKTYFLNHQVSYITFNSNWCKNEAIKKFNIKKTPCKVIYNGLPSGENLPNSTTENAPSEQKPEGKFIVGTISRFNKSKRIERLIEGFALFSKGKQDVMLLLVGDGVEMKNLENLVQESTISAITQFTGYKSETRTFHEMMDVCVFPFEKEAFGLVVLESFQLGKPVVIFEDSGGMREILGDNFPQDIILTVAELVERLNFYYSNAPNSSKEIVLRKQVVSKFSVAKMNSELLKCYKAILNEFNHPE